MNDEIWKPRILHPFQTHRHHIDTHEKRRKENFINIILFYLSFQLSEDIGYVLYSALGSFYIPSCIMVFVYIRIYYAAKARARRGIRKQPRKPPNEQVSENNSRSRLPKTLSSQQAEYSRNEDEKSRISRWGGCGGKGWGLNSKFLMFSIVENCEDRQHEAVSRWIWIRNIIFSSFDGGDALTRATSRLSRTKMNTQRRKEVDRKRWTLGQKITKGSSHAISFEWIYWK